jgi:CheY-like chemotaxis protein
MRRPVAKSSHESRVAARRFGFSRSTTIRSFATIPGLIAIHTDMTLVTQAANGREAIQQFRTHRPDVTLMDLQMPEMHGLDALIAIRTTDVLSRWPPTENPGP